MDKLYSKVLRKVTPSKKELKKEEKMFLEIEKKIMKIEGKHSHVEWCGSSARNTHLHGDRDLDLFVMFEKELDEKELEIEGLRIGKAVFRGQKWEKAYSQHPYIRGNYKGFEVEIVPSYKVSSGGEIKSAVDRTPFHNKYLLRKLSEKQKQEVRLLKQFMKGINCYGADLKSCALPGYGMELLILHYGNFDQTIQAIAEWTPGKILLFENAEEKDAEQFNGAPLIIIDPVDNNRNVASALSLEQFERMIYATKRFIEAPEEKFFFRQKTKPLPKKELKDELKKRELIAVLSTFPKSILADIMWGQLRRFLKKTENRLKEKDFVVERADLWSDEKQVAFVFTLKEKELQKVKTIYGPLASDEENAKRFLEKKRKLISGPRVEEGKLVLEVEREETMAIEVVKNLMKESAKTEKKGTNSVARKSKVLNEEGIIKNYKGEFASYLTRYLKGKEIFE